MHSNGNIKDSSYQPGLDSSSRRVREEEFDRTTPRPIWSNHLSFVPGRRKRLEPHDAQTRARIHEHLHLERLPHGSKLIRLVEEWRWIDRMHPVAAKQEHLERMILAARRDPVANEHILLFLLIALEPVRRAVSRAFVELRSGLDSPAPDASGWQQRGEAKLAAHLDRQALYDVTRLGTLEAVYRYPTSSTVALFRWFQETIAHRALDVLGGELAELETSGVARAEAEALQAAISGLDHFASPETNDAQDFAGWRRGLDMRGLYDVVDEFHRSNAIRRACDKAIGRLPRVQQQTINALFFDDVPAAEFAQLRKVSPSTVYNNAFRARNNLRADDVFFASLHALGAVRDVARAAELERLFPGGRLPDGRRIVAIPRRAA